MPSLSTLPKGDSAWLLRKSIRDIMQQVSVLETNIGSSTTGNSSNGQVIFNDNGTLRGDADMTFNSALNKFIVSSLEVSTTATISGNLTVDTNTFFVDSANDRVGVGTVSPTSKLHVLNTGAVTRITITDDTTNGRSGYIESNFSDALVIGTTSGVRAIRFSPDNKPYYQIATDGVQTWLDGIGGTRMTLNSTGLGVGVTPTAGRGAVQLSAGVGFPATQVASSDANTLDDYEEGTFTPTIVGTTVAGTGTYTTQLGRYTKVGRIVTCDISLVWTAHTGTGNIDIDGLPFSVLSTTGYAASAVIGYIENIALTAGNIPIAVLWWFNTTKIRLNQTPTGGGAAAGVLMDTAGQINLSITYIAA